MTAQVGLEHQTIEHLRIEHLRRHGDRPALVTADRVISYADLADRVEQSSLATLPRSLVAIMCRNTVETLSTYVAAMAHGHVVLLVPGDDQGAAAAIIDAYDPDVVSSDGIGLVVRRQHSRHDLHPDLALLLSTSGSTGSPKLVRLSTENVLSNAAAIAQYLDLSEDDRAVTTLPLHYCYGLSVVNSHLHVGASVVATELSVVDPCLWNLFDATGATSFAGVPYTFDLLDGVDFAATQHPTLRQVTVAGGRLDRHSVVRYAQLGRDRGWELVPMYGQTEATARMAYVPADRVLSHPTALGRAIPGGSLRLDPVPETTEWGTDVGELVYQGPNVMMGYAHRAADLTRGAEIDELRTGDLARLVAGDLYEWVGRRSRVAKLYGLRIDLDAVECALAAVCLSGHCVAENDRLQVFVQRDRPCAAVLDAVVGHCRLPAHAVDVIDVDEQPRTSTGKVDYAVLRQRAAELRVIDGDDTATDRVDHESVRTLIAHLLARPDASVDDSFQSLRGDSLSYVEVSIRLSELGLDLPPDWHRISFRTLVDSAATVQRPRTVRVEMSIILRAVAILLILGSHANVWSLPGGAHLLLVVVGFNLFRFMPAHEGLAVRMRRGLTSVAHVAVPSMLWIGGVALVSGMYTLPTVLMLNGQLGSDRWTVQWQFWFLEAIIWMQLGVLALTCLPWVERAIRKASFGAALTTVAATVGLRFALVGVEAGPTERYTLSIVLWCFALGWATWAARTPAQRLVVSGALLLAVPGFFGEPQREALVIAGVLALIWVPPVALPRWLARAIAVIATASLAIYLTQWQVYPLLEDRFPVLAMIASVLVGLLYHRCYSAAERWVGQLLSGHSSRNGLYTTLWRRSAS